jgi:hypothetical protein
MQSTVYYLPTPNPHFTGKSPRLTEKKMPAIRRMKRQERQSEVLEKTAAFHDMIDKKGVSD